MLRARPTATLAAALAALARPRAVAVGAAVGVAPAPSRALARAAGVSVRSAAHHSHAGGTCSCGTNHHHHDHHTADRSGTAAAAAPTPRPKPEVPDNHCWKCNHYDPTSTFFCKNASCSVILPTPDPAPNFFDLLQLDLPGAPFTPGGPAASSQAGGDANAGTDADAQASPRHAAILRHGFTVSAPTVKRAFLSLQQRLHPDNFSTKSDQERTISETSSMLVNRAYQTLRDPLSRAMYILDLHGITVPETPSAADRDVLLHVVQALEEIEDADLHADPDAIKDLVASNARRIEGEHRVIADAFARNEPEVARDAIVRLKYWRNIAAAADEKLGVSSDA